MKLPVPFESAGLLLTDVMLRKPNGNAIAKCTRLAKEGAEFSAVGAFVSGGVESYSGPKGTITDPAAVSSATDDLPWVLAEYITIQLLMLAGVDPEVELFSVCPRCQQKQVSSEPVRIDELKFKTESDPDNPQVPLVTVQLLEPVVFTDARNGEPLEGGTVSALTMRLATMRDCQQAQARAGADDARLQYTIWASSIVKHDGVDVDKKWMSAFGSNLFGKMATDGIRTVGRAMKSYALDNKVEVHCVNCGKVYSKEIPTSSFFASGLEEAAGNT